MTVKKGFNLVEVSNIPAMVKEWGADEQKAADRALESLFMGKRLTDHRGQSAYMNRLEKIENFFGLPYTSSSSFAMISNSNTLFYFDEQNEYNFDCLGVGKDGEVYIFSTDNAENEKVYKVI